MTQSPCDVVPFRFEDWSEVETCLDNRLAAASGLVGVALIEVDPSEREATAERLGEHVDSEDHTARVGDSRFVIVRSPLVGPAEMEGLGLRIADSFPSSTVRIGVVAGRCGDSAQTLLRHVEFGLDDAKAIGRPMVAIDDQPRASPGS
jgi:hypothetical protein